MKQEKPGEASTSTLPIKQEHVQKIKLPETPLRHHLPTSDLIDQLFNRTDGIVGLGDVVHRVVGHVFSQLEQLTEILPSKEDYERKQLLVRFIDESRKQLVRLLVVAKWSAHARYVKRAQDVLGFLQQQTTYLSGTVDAVDAIRQQLSDVRLRNFDIATALDVLTTGSFNTAPAIIRQQLAGPERLPDELVRLTLLELDELLRYRLAVEEDLPIPMRHYSISDGKARFVVSTLFEVCLTLAGDAEDDPWLCLDVEFLPKTGPPGKLMKDEVLSLIRQQLERPADLPSDERDAPLGRIYVFLRDLSLDVRLERLATEAAKLATEMWKGNLSVTLSREERTLSVSYWIHAISASTARLPANVPKPPPPVPPRILIAVMARRPSAKAIIEHQDGNELEVDQDLAWMWEPRDVEEARSDFEPLGPEMSIASLLGQTTRKHVHALCRQAVRSILQLQSPAFADLSRQRLERDGLLYGFRESLHHSMDLDVLIDQHSGRYRLQPQAEVSASLRDHLRGIERDVNASRDRLAQALSQVRALVSIEAIEAHASSIGLPVVKISSLRPNDQERIGSPPHVLFLVPLVNSSPYFLLVVASPVNGPCFAIASMSPPDEHCPTWSCRDLAWIKTPSLLLLSRVSADQFLDIHRYASVRVAHLRMEQQLTSRLLPFQRRAAAKSVKTDPLADFPLLVIRLDDLLPEATFAHRAVAISLRHVAVDKPCRVDFYLRLVKVSTALLKSLPEGCEVDSSTRLVVARFEDDPDEAGGGALQAFLELLSTLARVTRPAPARRK